MTEADNTVLRGLMQAQSALKWVDENWTKPAADRGAGLPSCRAALAAVEAGLLALSDARSETERLRWQVKQEEKLSGQRLAELTRARAFIRLLGKGEEFEAELKRAGLA
jgi:hypothetical protein